jgi:2,5-diketo-D-gluconate reductase B
VTALESGYRHVDLLYVHWPTDAYDPEETLPAFDRLRDEGAVRHVAVSNFTVETLERARAVLDAPIIDLVAWSPLVRGEALSLPAVTTVAEKHDASAAQVVLAWLFEYNIDAVVTSETPAHIRDNLGGLDLALDEEDIARIESVDRRTRLFDREGAPWNR